jgi:AcrR family transcriptional regulator
VGTSDADDRIDGRRARWDDHKRERRTAILDAAIEVIEAHEAGAEIHVQEIAERAGIARPVIYRHFADRSDLDRAVQQRAIEMLLDELDLVALLEGTIGDVIDRIVGTYVAWAGSHPALHRVGVREGLGNSGSPLRGAIEGVADVIRPLIQAGAEQFGAKLTQDDLDSLDLLVFALVSSVVGAVRLWLSRPERLPTPEALTRLLADNVWFQLQGLARTRGGDIDPRGPIADIVVAALAARVDAEPS